MRFKTRPLLSELLVDELITLQENTSPNSKVVFSPKLLNKHKYKNHSNRHTIAETELNGEKNNETIDSNSI